MIGLVVDLVLLQCLRGTDKDFIGGVRGQMVKVDSGTCQSRLSRFQALGSIAIFGRGRDYKPTYIHSLAFGSWVHFKANQGNQ